MNDLQTRPSVSINSEEFREAFSLVRRIATDPDYVEYLEARTALEAIRKVSAVKTVTESITAATKLALGRVLLRIQRARIWQLEGCRSFNEFMEKICPQLGVPRSEAYEAKAIAERFPTISIDKLDGVTARQLRIMAKLGGESSEHFQTMLETAKVTTDDGFAQSIRSLVGDQVDDLNEAIVVIRTTVGAKSQWQQMIADEAIKAYAWPSAGQVFESMVSEVYPHWLSQINQMPGTRTMTLVVPEDVWKLWKQAVEKLMPTAGSEAEVLRVALSAVLEQ